MKMKVKDTWFEFKMASFVSVGMGLTAWVTTYVDARLTTCLPYHAREYPMGYWILFIIPIIFVAMYLGSVWDVSWYKKIMLAEMGLVIVGVISLFNFIPGFPHGNMSTWLVLYCIASTIAYWIHYTPVRSDYTSWPDIVDDAKIERAKESINLWRIIGITIGAGYLGIILQWSHLLGIEAPNNIASDVNEKSLVGIFLSIQLVFFSIFIIFGLLYESYKKTEDAANVLLSIKKDKTHKAQETEE
jgi:hypothetical protein